jgi:hypothetical protein
MRGHLGRATGRTATRGIASGPSLGPTQPIQWVPGTVSLGVKRPRREAEHSPPSSTEVKYAWSYTSTPPYVFMSWCLIKHRDYSTLPDGASGQLHAPATLAPGKQPWYPLDRRLGGPQNRSEHLWTVPGIEPQFLEPSRITGRRAYDGMDMQQV